MTASVTTCLLLVLAATISCASATAPAPAFDCAKASGEIEELVCQDAGLAALDRKMAEVYEKAKQAWPAEEVAKQKTLQRGWIKGRNDCWKADDKRSCAELSYRTRIVELRIQSGQLKASKPVGYACTGGEKKPLFATFYNEADPPCAVITFGDDQVIAFQARSASGARYTAANMEFWEHHGEAAVDWFGIKLQCKALPPAGRGNSGTSSSLEKPAGF